LRVISRRSLHDRLPFTAGLVIKGTVPFPPPFRVLSLVRLACIDSLFRFRLLEVFRPCRAPCRPFSNAGLRNVAMKHLKVALCSTNSLKEAGAPSPPRDSALPFCSTNGRRPLRPRSTRASHAFRLSLTQPARHGQFPLPLATPPPGGLAPSLSMFRKADRQGGLTPSDWV